MMNKKRLRVRVTPTMGGMVVFGKKIVMPAKRVGDGEVHEAEWVDITNNADNRKKAESYRERGKLEIGGEEIVEIKTSENPDIVLDKVNAASLSEAHKKGEVPKKIDHPRINSNPDWEFCRVITKRGNKIFPCRGRPLKNGFCFVVSHQQIAEEVGLGLKK